MKNMILKLFLFFFQFSSCVRASFTLFRIHLVLHYSQVERSELLGAHFVEREEEF